MSQQKITKRVQVLKLEIEILEEQVNELLSKDATIGKSAELEEGMIRYLLSEIKKRNIELEQLESQL